MNDQEESQRATPPLVGKCQQVHQNIKVDKWGPVYIAGRVSQSVHEWAKITSDRNILRDLRSFKLDFKEIPKQERPLPEIGLSKQAKQFVRKEIKTKKVLVPVEHMAGEFISNNFLREKKDQGKYRMILNLKHLNTFTEKKHFKMDTLMTTLSLVRPNCTFLSFDFTDAYYACSIFPPHRKYLWFTFDGTLYEYTTLPNGLSTAPRFFTKIMKVALAHLREKATITVSGYLDDNILVNYRTPEAALNNGIFAAELFQRLGFTINIDKSVISPTTTIEHLGFIINSRTMTVSMTNDKT